MEAKKSFFQRLFGLKETEVAEKNKNQEFVFSAEYLQALVQRANARTSDIFYNSGVDYAKPTVGFIIASAMEMEEVLIYSHSLGPVFYKDALRGLKCPARILLDDSVGVSIIKSLPQEIQNRVSVRIFPSLERKDSHVHFMVTDYAFRCGEKDKDDELSGWCDFNNPPKAKSWREHFEKLWEKALPVSTD